MSTYNIALNEKQAEILVRALDLYTRIGIGQFEEVEYVYNSDLKLDLQQAKRIRAGLDIAKAEAGHPPTGSYGIHNPEVHDEFRVSYDLKQVIRNRLAWDRNPEGGLQVCYDEPRQIGEEPLAKIEKIG